VTYTSISSVNPATISGATSVCAGNSATLTDATIGGTWSSSNTSVAPIYALTGVVVAGSATGTATITYNKAGCFVTQTITVNTNPITAITGPTSVCAGSSISLSEGSLWGTWSSSNTSISIVAGTGTLSSTILSGHPARAITSYYVDGVVTGIASGTATITYSNGGCYKTTTVTVNAPAAITGTALLCAGSTSSLSSATAGGSWSSGSTSVASVNPAGVVTGVSTGYATLSYTVGGCATTDVVTVNINALPTITGYDYFFFIGRDRGSYDTLSVSAVGGVWSSSDTTTVSISSTDTLYHLSGTYPYIFSTPYESQAAAFVYKGGSGTSVISYTLSNGCYTTFDVFVNDTATFNIVVDSTPDSRCTDGGYSYTYYYFYYLFPGDTIFITEKCKGGLGGGGSAKGLAGGGKRDNIYVSQGNYQTNATADVNITFSIYPNPNTGLLKLMESIPTNQTVQVAILNQLGQILLSKEIEFSGGTAQADLSDLINGAYIVEISGENISPQKYKLVILR